MLVLRRSVSGKWELLIETHDTVHEVSEYVNWNVCIDSLLVVVECTHLVLMFDVLVVAKE